MEDKTYLELKLKEYKWNLNELKIQHRIKVSVFNEKVDLMQAIIESIEKQLEKKGE